MRPARAGRSGLKNKMSLYSLYSIFLKNIVEVIDRTLVLYVLTRIIFRSVYEIFNLSLIKINTLYLIRVERSQLSLINSLNKVGFS